MTTIKTTITIATISALIVGVGLVLKPTTTHSYPQSKESATYAQATTNPSVWHAPLVRSSNVSIATGQTAMYPNVTPQTASGSPQKANVTPQATATTADQYSGGTITN